MSPLVSFLVGHVRNYFQKFVCMRTMSDQSMTFSETTKWGTIHLECGNSFTRSLSLEKHLAWTHGRLCHPPLLSLIWGQASSLVDLVWRVFSSWSLHCEPHCKNGPGAKKLATWFLMIKSWKPKHVFFRKWSKKKESSPVQLIWFTLCHSVSLYSSPYPPPLLLIPAPGGGPLRHQLPHWTL